MIAAVIQARISSERLPGKMLFALPWGDRTSVLACVVERLARAKKIPQIVLATSSEPQDDALESVARNLGIECFRGAKDDVLGRFAGAAQKFNLSTIVRVCGDSPFIEPSFLDAAVELHQNRGAEFTSNYFAREVPRGTAAEVLDVRLLMKLEKICINAEDREHLTRFIYKNHRQFQCEMLAAPAYARRPEVHLTLDTPEDYIFLACLAACLPPSSDAAGIEAVLKVIDARPWLLAVNHQEFRQRLEPKKRRALEGAMARFAIEGPAAVLHIEKMK